jgi:hypothetical protein
MTPRMTPNPTTITVRRCRLAAAAVLAILPVLAGQARAACFTDPAGRPLQLAPAARFAPPSADSAQPGQSSQSAKPGAITGMWLTEFLLGQGPDRFDQGFQVFHADGTEVMLSNGLPPALGNVCLGVWDQSARRIRLRHVAWNWDAEGRLTGTFILLASLRLDHRGRVFDGTWSADSYDLSNTVIPELHAEGVVRGSRVPVD